MQLFLCGLSLIQMFNLKEIFNLIFAVSGKLISREKKISSSSNLFKQKSASESYSNFIEV